MSVVNGSVPALRCTANLQLVGATNGLLQPSMRQRYGFGNVGALRD
jgi:hypothetical protein